MDKEFLVELISTPSPSGKEEYLQRKIKRYLTGAADEFISDDQKNLISVFNKDSDYKVLLCAHSDEISLIVDGYNGDGTLRVSSNGGVRASVYLGSHVDVVVNDKRYPAVVGFNDGLCKKENLRAGDLFIDLGIRDLKKVKELVPLGSYVVHSSTLRDLDGSYFAGRALDDRLGAYIITLASKRAKEKGASAGIYSATSTGEETTKRGAYYVGSRVKADIAVIVDVTYASDVMGSDMHFDVEVGKGGVICLGSLPNQILNERIRSVSKKLNLPIQEEVWAGRTCTDGDDILMTNGGTPIVLFSIPLRYMHSPIEIASYDDVDSMVEILSEFLKEITAPIDLNVI